MMDARGVKVDAAFRAGLYGLKVVARYKYGKFGYRDGRYVQLREDEFAV
jgi:electron-transferring-flavoprotein dehydrogenase